MGLTEEERQRLADVVRLQPTKNSELGERWGMESGSEVHSYLEDHLGDYYYRDEDSYIRATEAAADLVDVDPGVEGGEDGPRVVRVPALEARVFDVLAGPDERSQSVVSTLHDLREEHDVDPSADDVRKALRALKRKGVVEVEYRAVPTFRRAPDAEDVTVEALDEGDGDSERTAADAERAAEGTADAERPEEALADAEGAEEPTNGARTDVLEEIKSEFGPDAR